ncbi:MAG: VPLPA-CTERM sorting domain-containing protein [Pseudomonadota bacterium]
MTLTDTGSGFFCNITNCGVSAELASGLAGTSFNLINPGNSQSFDFLTLTGSGIGITVYDIVATIAFDPPNFAVTGNGAGGSLLFFGQIIAGVLNWVDLPQTVVLDDGSVVSVNFTGGNGFFLGSSETVLAEVTLVSVAAVPLPASLALLLAGLGGLGLIASRRQTVAA